MFTYAPELIPFSRRGSFLLITSRNSSGSPRLLYKTCSAQIHSLHDIPFPADEFFELALWRDGADIPYTWHAYPHRLDLIGETGEMAGSPDCVQVLRPVCTDRLVPGRITTLSPAKAYAARVTPGRPQYSFCWQSGWKAIQNRNRI